MIYVTKEVNLFRQPQIIMMVGSAVKDGGEFVVLRNFYVISILMYLAYHTEKILLNFNLMPIWVVNTNF